MAHHGGHAADLVVFAFDKLHRDPTLRHALADSDRWNPRRDVRLGIDQPGSARKRSLSPDDDSTLELGEGFG